MQDKTTSEDAANEPAAPAEELDEEALATASGGGGGLVPRAPGPAPQTP